MTTKLPDKPSELIRLSLGDLRRAGANPRQYTVNMSRWHHPLPTGKRCLVCQAGAVMAFSLGAKIESYALPSDFDRDTERKLLAIDWFRDGDIERGLKEMRISWPAGLPKVMHVPPYGYGAQAFFDRQEEIISVLEKAGL